MAQEKTQQEPKAVLLVQRLSRLSLEIASGLAALGIQVLGPVETPREAHESLGQQSFDFAVIDIDLGSFVCRRVAQLLNERGVRYVVYSGASPSTGGAAASV